jgi:D-beta-D-heptose 7-phosphate kinase/D-beta-D-heptose 1-phosphate adenosyltransferase
MALSPARIRSLLDKISGLRVLVIGDVMLDHYVWGDATRISPEAPVPVVEIKRDTYTPGGAANVALNCSSLGAKPTIAGFMGEDEAGRRIRGILKASGVKPISTTGTGTTIIKTRVILQHQQLCRLDREGPPASYRMEAKAALKRLAAEIAEADALIFSDYAKGLLTDDLVAAITARARAKATFVALDPKPRNALRFRDLDLLTPNRREAAQLAGIELSSHEPFPAEEICQRIHQRYQVRNLVITLSEDGMLLSRDGHVLKQIPTAAREVFDVSGAGDTSIAGLVLALAAGADLETAAHFANAAAGVVVGKLGTATVTPAELIAYVARKP